MKSPGSLQSRPRKNYAKYFSFNSRDTLWSRNFIIIPNARTYGVQGVTGLAQGHTANKWQSCTLSPGYHSRADDFNHHTTLDCTKSTARNGHVSIFVPHFLSTFQTNLD